MVKQWQDVFTANGIDGIVGCSRYISTAMSRTGMALKDRIRPKASIIAGCKT